MEEPEKIRAGMDGLTEDEVAARAGEPGQEAKAWARKVAECDRVRAAYQDQQAAGHMTLDELGAKLGELEDARELARAGLRDLQTRAERVEELERDRDALLEPHAAMLPGALDELSGEERSRLYGMLRIEVAPAPGGFEVSGAFCASEPSSSRTLSSNCRHWLSGRAICPYGLRGD